MLGKPRKKLRKTESRDANGIPEKGRIPCNVTGSEVKKRFAHKQT